jgi:hypothetical protein
MHQERLGGNFDAGALRQYDAAAVDDIENGDGLARLALGVERVAAEIYEVESDSDDQQDRPRVARLGDVLEPIRLSARVGGLVARGRRRRLGVGAHNLFGDERQKPNP